MLKIYRSHIKNAATCHDLIIKKQESKFYENRLASETIYIMTTGKPDPVTRNAKPGGNSVRNLHPGKRLKK